VVSVLGIAFLNYESMWLVLLCDAAAFDCVGHSGELRHGICHFALDTQVFIKLGIFMRRVCLAQKNVRKYADIPCNHV